MLPPKADFDEAKVRELAGAFYAAKEQVRQAQMEAMAAVPASGPVAAAPALELLLQTYSLRVELRRAL